MKIAVIGAGPAGLTAAYRLGKEGIDVDIYELSPKVGGLAKTIRVLDHELEMGAHFLRVSYFERLIQLMPELKTVQYRKVRRATGILYRDKLFAYPPAVKDLARNFSPLDLLRFTRSYLSTKRNGFESPADAGTYLGKQLGAELYHDFFEPYIQKIWGLSGAEVDAVFASSLIGNRELSLKKVFRNLLHKQNMDSIQNFNDIIYPENGFSAIWGALETAILQHGSRILTNTRILNIDRKKEGGIIIKSMNHHESMEEYAFVIATIPPVQLADLFNVQSSSVKTSIRELRYRNILLIYLRATLKQEFLQQCLYLYDDKTPMVRVTCFSNFSAAPGSEVFLSIEYWLGNEDRKWQLENEELQQEAETELGNLPMFSGIKVLESKVLKIKNAYLIPFLGMPKRLQDIQSYFGGFPELILTGRSQAKNFNYSIEDAMDDGWNAAGQILSNTN